MCKSVLWKRAALSIWAPLRNLEGALLHFERQMEGSGNGVSITMGAL